jgi:hypothetical protein
MATFLKKFSETLLLDSPALFFLSTGCKNSAQKKNTGYKYERALSFIMDDGCKAPACFLLTNIANGVATCQHCFLLWQNSPL